MERPKTCSVANWDFSFSPYYAFKRDGLEFLVDCRDVCGNFLVPQVFRDFAIGKHPYSAV